MPLLTLYCFFLTLRTVFYIFGTIYPYLSLLFSNSVFLFSRSFSYCSRHETHSTIYNFDSISLQPTDNITVIKKILYSSRRKKRCRVSYNHSKCSNIIIFSTKHEFFLPSYQLPFF